MDWKWTVTAVLPVVSLILGAWLTQRNEGRREEAALRREAQVRRLDRQTAIDDRRETFELTHLQEMYDMLFEHFQLAVYCRNAYDDDRSPGEHADALMTLNRKISTAMGLILDDQIRELADAAHLAANRLSLGGRDQDYTAEADTWVHLQSAHAVMAARLRDIYSNGSVQELR